MSEPERGDGKGGEDEAGEGVEIICNVLILQHDNRLILYGRIIMQPFAISNFSLFYEGGLLMCLASQCSHCL